ncbi:hypothetical protein JZ751_029888 [Albula glossodonta]|uniref:Uncharacterized protein n=1 Tax=Albula glossodonta TaxID=121402 RepID=A0A8T2N9P0_9TELE|nr:hypothetical protein JZ751_029888 [Albula glossodonta]
MFSVTVCCVQLLFLFCFSVPRDLFLTVLFVATDMELSSPTSVTTRVASVPVATSQITTTTTQTPELIVGSREFVLRDDPTATSRSFESLPGVLQGQWEVQSGESNQMVHMNVLITCVLAAFLLGAMIAGMVVYCYRDAFLRKPRRIHKDGELAQSCTDSAGSFAKLNGLFDSPVKEYQQGMVDSPKLYTNLLSTGKDPPPSADHAKVTILGGQCHQPPELSALPTPESTPVLQQKSLQPIRNQWEKAHGKVAPSRRESPPKSPQYYPSSPPPHPHSPMGHGHIPSAVVLPNATHEYRASFSSSSGCSEMPRPERKVQNAEQLGGSRSGRKENRRSVDARNTLNDLLKHLNDSSVGGVDGGGPKAILADAPSPRQNLMLEPMGGGGLMEVPPKVPSREASLYSPSSSLPRNSPTKRVDVPTTPTTPTGQMDTLERQRGGYHRGSQRHSISALPKNMNSPNGVGVPVSRQPSMNRGGGYMPPTPPSRLDSHGMPRGGHPQPSLSRQSSYSGQGSLPRMGVKRTPSLKPDVPPKPNGFVPQTAQIRVVNKYSY